MPLPEPILDDLRFQKDLVDEARRRINRYCPEWTDYNLSDPGITLIELFAWMTEMICYRLNQVPEKNYIRFMDLLGVRLLPASSARTTLTFYLSTLFPITPDDDTTVSVPAGFEVATRRTDEEDEITFTTDERLTIVSPKLSLLYRENDRVNYLARLIDRQDKFFLAFSPRPKKGDSFYLGFDETHNLTGHILQLQFQVDETQGTGIQRNDPPWIWECSVGGDDQDWEDITPRPRQGEREKLDTTGGLNDSGYVTLALPLTLRPRRVNGRSAYWLRCRIDERPQNAYSESPRVREIRAYSVGATTWASHAVFTRDELLGRSAGEPGQLFRLQHAPVLAPRDDEAVEVEEIRDGESVFVRWAPVNDFSVSDRFDRHYTLDCDSGEIAFGPCIRQRDGSMRQYGRVPEAGRLIQLRRYRHGGGAAGNVPAGKLQVLKSAIPYIDRVTNPHRAEGGRDAEALDEARLRARREIRSQQRAVTAEDFENLARGATRQAARVKCRTPQAAGEGAVRPGVVELLIVPAAFDSLAAGDLSKLTLDPELIQQVQKHLDHYRLLTTFVRVREPNYVGVKVTGEIVVAETAQPEIVVGRVVERLRQFISPLALTPAGENGPAAGLEPNWEGRPFGRSLFISEVFTLIQGVPGVKHVLDVNLSYRPVSPAALGPKPERGGAETPAPEAGLTPVTQRRLDTPDDTLLCSLEHQITVSER